MIPSRNLSVRRGNGWTIVETAGIQRTTGTHDIGAPLGIGEGKMLLVVLRAAERWAPALDCVTEITAILRREGQLLLELDDGSTQPLDVERDRWTGDRSPAGIVNIGTRLAEALVIAR